MDEDPYVVIDKLRAENQALAEKVNIKDNAESSRKPGSFPAKPESNPKPSCNTLNYASPYGYLDVDSTYESLENEEMVEEESFVEHEVVDKAEPLVKVVKEEGTTSKLVHESNVENESVRIVNEFVQALSSPLMGEAIKGHFLVSKLVKDLAPMDEAYEDVAQPIFKDEDQVELSNKERDALFKARKSLRDLGIHIDKGKDLHQVRTQLEFAKSILANKAKVGELVETYDSTMANRKVLKKTCGKGMFTIPCSIGTNDLKDAFCDSGSVVSVISYSMAKTFGLEGMEPWDGHLSFGDCSVRKPKGVFKDFPIKVGDTYVPTDLVVLDTVDGRNRAVILGIPFMLTVGAKLDYVKRVVSFEFIDKNVFYPIEKTDDFVHTIFEESSICSDNGEANISIPTIRVVRDEDACEIIEPKDVADSFHEDELVDKNPEPPLSKRTKRRKRSKAKKKTVASTEEVKEVPMSPVAVPLIFKPIAFEDGKLVCKVKATKGARKPFGMVRIILDAVDDDGNGGSITEKMIKTFGMQFGDPGPNSKEGPPPSDH